MVYIPSDCHPKRHRFYATKKELDDYKLKHPDDLWYSISYIKERENINAPYGVRIVRSNPYWKKGKYYGLWQTFYILKYIPI